MARRTKLTDTVVSKICDAIAIGATNRIAGLYAGVSEPCILNWLNQGRKEKERIDQGEEPLPEDAKFLTFLRKYTDAEARAYIGWLQVIDISAQKDPHWASYMLERRDRAYAARQEVTASIDISRLSDEQLERLANGENVYNVLAAKSAG